MVPPCWNRESSTTSAVSATATKRATKADPWSTSRIAASGAIQGAREDASQSSWAIAKAAMATTGALTRTRMRRSSPKVENAVRASQSRAGVNATGQLPLRPAKFRAPCQPIPKARRRSTLAMSMARRPGNLCCPATKLAAAVQRAKESVQRPNAPTSRFCTQLNARSPVRTAQTTASTVARVWASSSTVGIPDFRFSPG